MKTRAILALAMIVLGATWPGLVSGVASADLAETVFHVALTGQDTNPGTAQAPFRSLARAQAAVRAEVGKGLRQPVRVVIGAGIYYLNQTLLLEPSDSGTAEHAITWCAAAGGKVVLSGGRPVTGWTRQEGNLWSAAVPWARQKGFRELYVNGKRAVRARAPNTNAAVPYWLVRLSNLSGDLSTFELGFGEGQPPALARPGEAEVVTLGNFEVFRKSVTDFQPAAGVLVLAPPHLAADVAPWNWPRVGRWGFLEGAREFLDAPGEWYLDQTAGVVYYQAAAGEDLSTAEVIAPVLTQILEIRGRPEQPVRNVQFSGLSFAHAAWSPPPGGYYGVQACHFMTGGAAPTPWRLVGPALRWQWAEQCALVGGEVAHTGGSGVHLATGSRQCRIEGNRVWDIGGNGLQVGNDGGPDNPETVTDPAVLQRVVQDNRIANNDVHHCGAEYYGAVGIWVGFAASTTVAHNLVHDLPYSGISVGWRWAPTRTVIQDNVVEYNHIYRVMKLLTDGAGIYTLGWQPGSILRGNLIHDVWRSPYAQGPPNDGIFFDQFSKGFLVEANTVYNTADQPVRHNKNQPNWHTWKDNSLGSPPQAGTPAAQAAAQAGLEEPWRQLLQGEA